MISCVRREDGGLGETWHNQFLDKYVLSSHDQFYSRKERIWKWEVMFRVFLRMVSNKLAA